ELDFKFTNLDSGGEILGLGVSLISYLGDNADRFYSIVRAGVSDTDGHPNDDYTAFHLGGGLGYRMPLLGFGDLRVEGMLTADLHSNESSSVDGEKQFFIDPTITVGYQIPLFERKAAAAPARPVEVVASGADSDDDGVPDDVDLCPGTPIGTRVDSTGCAPAIAPAVDSECREPQANDAVDANGCAVSSGNLLAAVLFEFDSDRLTTEARATLDNVASNLAGTSGRVEVAGHASDEGDEFYNLDLSQRRASTVRRYLIDQGVSPARILSRGYGDEVPESDNTSASGRRDNRRVEVRTAR
ncbi:MAG: OmpA family protein, partial [Oceanococcaceae bacterium]